MIIEIKDLPSGQTIDKIDIHIDFQKGLATVVTPVPPVPPTTRNKIPDVEYVLLNNSQSEQSDKTPEVPKEMFDVEF